MPHPSNHLHPAAATGGVKPDQAWQAWDQAWTKHITTLTGRSDLSVTVAPGAGGGAPACFYPDIRRVEVDATHIGTPDAADPRRAAHKRQVPTAYGLLVHEAGHAAHSRWLPVPPGTPPVVADAALLLEESRAEGHHRARRPRDRRWLRHTVITLLSGDEAPVDDPWYAGQVAGLLLARVDARIITAKDVRAARAAVLAVLGRKRLAALRDIWRAAHTVADTDTATMVELGWRWCANPEHRPRHPPRRADRGRRGVPRATGRRRGRPAGRRAGHHRQRVPRPGPCPAAVRPLRHPTGMAPPRPHHRRAGRGPAAGRPAAAGPHPQPRTGTAARRVAARTVAYPRGDHRRRATRRRRRPDRRAVAAARATAPRTSPPCTWASWSTCPAR